MTQPLRPRRSCLSVPGSSPRFLEKARSLNPDQLILDLEDSVAPEAKDAARELVAAALTAGGWGTTVMTVRINDATSRWAWRDVTEVAGKAGRRLDAIVLPKVAGPAQVAWLDILLGQAEQDAGLEPGRIGIEAQIEDARGLEAAAAIAASSPRLQTLIFGPADFMASVGMQSLGIGVPPPGYPGDAFGYPLLRILVAARAHGLQAIDGPYAAISSPEGLRQSAASAAALGYDGKWVIHPSQIGIVNAEFSPDQATYDRAEAILDAYSHATSVAGQGAAMLGGEMIDEASRKLALAAAARGRAAGLTRTAAPGASADLTADGA